MDWELTEAGRECLKILALSYNNLPNRYLKSCFLYMGVFPEDSEIKASELVRLWIAEGFIQQRGHESTEDTTCSYLEELVQRSLIQVIRRSMYHGGISQCRIHDLLRETCLVEAKQAGFLNIVCDDDNNGDIPISRRFALHNLTNNHSPYLSQNLRSLFVSSYKVDDFSLPGLKLLRVLELNGDCTRKLLEEIRSMTHLRYLKIDEVSLSECFIIKLIQWQLGCCWPTLDCRELPDLRHLYLPTGTDRVRTLAITTLTKLQTLKNVVGDEQWIKGNLARLTNLRSLSIRDYEGDGNALSLALGSLLLL